MNENTMENFAFTIKDNRRETSDYNVVFDDWQLRNCIVRCKYREIDSSGKEHYHGIISIPKKVFRKLLCPKGYHLLLKPLVDEEGWLMYCRKDQDPEEDTDDNDLMSKLKQPLFRRISTKRPIPKFSI